MNCIASDGFAWHRQPMKAIRIAGTFALCLANATLVTTMALHGVSPAAAAADAVVQGQLTNAAPLLRVAPVVGFVDDAVWSDGNVAAYILSDAGDQADVHVVDLGTRAERVLPLPVGLRQPTALRVFGDTLVVVANNDGGGQQVQWLPLGKKGSARKVVATEASFQDRAGKPVLVLYSRVDKAKIYHSVEVLDAATGKRIAKARVLETDGDGNTVGSSKALTFRINHWDAGRTMAFGIREGSFNPKEKQRSPDHEAAYDVVAGKFVPVPGLVTGSGDLFERRHRFETLRDRSELTFVTISHDLTGVDFWQRGRKAEVAELDLANYKTASLVSSIGSDSLWLGLMVDPANNEAISHKRLDPEFFDVFRVVDGKATRVFHIPAANRQFGLGSVAPGVIWLTERNRGFTRGSKVLEIIRVP
jgi:hypothetical protein